MWIVYILLSKKIRKTYVGSTNDIVRRLHEHNSGKSNFTKKYTPWEVIYTENYSTKEEARNREKFLKSTTGRRFLKKMINGIIDKIVE